MNLKASYMGLPLKNPLIVASSTLTSSVEKIISCEEAGAGAVIVRSLFEEQIINDKKSLLRDVDLSVHADAYDFFNQSTSNYFLDQYLSLVEKAQKSVMIPVIPSLNCVSNGNWLEYAIHFQEIGCKALELNLFLLPANVSQTGQVLEQNYLKIARKIKETLSIPVALKLGSHFSGMANLFHQFSDEIGIDGLVLFNRFYRNDIDIDSVKLVSGSSLSHASEMEQSLRWIALLSGELKADLVAATGIHSSEDIIKQLLVGAKAVQLCSTLLEKGLGQISLFLTEIESWMKNHQYEEVTEFNGILCQERSKRPEEYERVQYVKSLVHLK